MSIDRVPTMTDALATLIDAGVRFGSVLDVGVNYETTPLKNTFPNLKHHLFEPVQFYFDYIESGYKEVPHLLHRVALSDQQGTAYLNSYAMFGDGKISHSHLADKPASSTDDFFVRCTEVAKTTLDREMANDDGAPYLLKIDVDGHEPQVLSGAQDTLRRTAAVVIEATLPRVPVLIDRFAEWGFRLFDVVDLSYYRAMLQQVDLVFVRDDLMRENPWFDRWATPFDLTYWHVHSPYPRWPGITDEDARTELAATRAELDAMRNARSWRMTAPLRAMVRWARQLRRA